MDGMGKPGQRLLTVTKKAWRVNMSFVTDTMPLPFFEI